MSWKKGKGKWDNSQRCNLHNSKSAANLITSIGTIIKPCGTPPVVFLDDDQYTFRLY